MTAGCDLTNFDKLNKAFQKEQQDNKYFASLAPIHDQWLK